MSLHYGDPQIALGLVFAVLVLLLATAFVVIAVQAGSEVGVERVHDVGYWLRKRRSRRGLVVRDPVHSTLEQRERSN